METVRDENGIQTLLATKSNFSIVGIKANPITHRLKTQISGAALSIGPTNAPRNENSNPALLITDATSEEAVTAFGDTTGRLLIQDI